MGCQQSEENAQLASEFETQVEQYKIYNIDGVSLRLMQGYVHNSVTDVIAIESQDEQMNPSDEISELGGDDFDDLLHESVVKNDKLYLNQSRITETAGKLKKYQYIIHTHGPKWQGGSKNEEQTLAAVIENIIRMCLQQGIKSITFPLLATKFQKYPVRKVAEILVQQITQYLYIEKNSNSNTLSEIHIIHKDDSILDLIADKIEEKQAKLVGKQK